MKRTLYWAAFLAAGTLSLPACTREQPPQRTQRTGDTNEREVTTPGGSESQQQQGTQQQGTQQQGTQQQGTGTQQQGTGTQQGQSGQTGSATMTHRVEQLFQQEPTLAQDARNINVTHSGDSIILRGQVSSEQARTRAEQLAQQIAGPGNVRNELQVQQQPGAQPQQPGGQTPPTTP